jgi:membrane protease subunit HflK
MHWWIATMTVLYALSGITVVRSDEVAMILRWGRLVGETPALQQHRAGLLFALPRPIDQVVRVQTKKVREVRVYTLAPGAGAVPVDDDEGGPGTGSLDPLTQGYAVTGDQNIVQLTVVARYRVSDPGAWEFYGPSAEAVLRTEVTAAMVRSIGEMGVDRVLSDGRKDLIAIAARRAQAGLDAAHSGLELSSLELTRLAPPAALVIDFSAVQSAFIGAETKKKDAQAFAETAVPQAAAQTNAALQAARATADADLARARGESEAFRALDHEYRANPGVVRERLYRDGIEKAIAAANVRWVPPPIGGGYHGLRITIGPPGSTGKFIAPGGEPEHP